MCIIMLNQLLCLLLSQLILYGAEGTRTDTSDSIYKCCYYLAIQVHHSDKYSPLLLLQKMILLIVGCCQSEHKNHGSEK